MKKVFISLLIILPAFASAQSVDILWFGNNYVPPFYKGLPLWTNHSEIKLVAVPQGLGNPATLNYVWIRNGTILGLVSGAGKNSLSFLDTIFSKPVKIDVEIISDNEELLAKDSVVLTPTAARLLVYEKSPLYGYLFHNEASAGYKLRENEVTFAAFPLFFLAGGREQPGLRYSWRSNAGGSETDDTVTYRAPEGSEGSASVSVGIEHVDFFRQKDQKSFLVQFGNQND